MRPLPPNFKPLGGLAGDVVERARQRAALARKEKAVPAMSIETCANCTGPVDTDKDPESQVEIGNMRKLTKVETLCQSCREQLIEKREIEDANAALCEQQAEKAS